MSAPADHSELTPREAADLSALADGSLELARRDEVQAWIDASPERTMLYERERRVVELLHEARIAERAPDALRARLEAARPKARAARRRAAWSGGLAGAVAAAALALVLTLSAGAPSLAQATAAADRGPAAPAPTPDPNAPRAQLGSDVDDVYFPNWSSTGWRAVGQRTDTLGGRRMVTVYYQWAGTAQVAYTIVSQPALDQPAAPVSYLHGLALRTLTINHRLVVTWRRGDHTCILSSAHDVPAADLRALAAWHPAT